MVLLPSNVPLPMTVDAFWLSSSYPKGLMMTSSDPYKSGSMTLGVNYNSNNDSFSTGSFNQAITFQFIGDNNTAEQSQTLSEFRHSDFYPRVPRVTADFSAAF